jgi:hypothetical protein
VWPQLLLTLEQLQRLTRVLCWSILASGLASVILWVVAFVLLASSNEWWPTIFMLAGVVFLAHTCTALFLAIWRTCDRCSFHLYPFNNAPGVDSMVHRSGYSESRFPDYRAESFLGSFRWGAIVSMARRGVAHCMWCGHADGAKLETG